MIFYLPRSRRNIISVAVRRSMAISLRHTSSLHMVHVHCRLFLVNLGCARRQRRVTPGFVYASHFSQCRHLATSPTSREEASDACQDEEKEAKDKRQRNG